jgi:aminoglycoside phosphotransferase family enzyme
MIGGCVESTESSARVHETHSAVVFLVGDRAYKIKKPVDLGILDFSTLESRRQACLDELALNRRSAPDVYLGTARLVDDHENTLEHLLVMKRLSEDQRLDSLVSAGSDIHPWLDGVVDALASLHQQRAVGPDEGMDVAGPEVLRSLWQGCTATICASPAGTVDAETTTRVMNLAMGYLDGRKALLTNRIDQGRIVDGHGDLQAADVYCTPAGVKLLDCLDFSPALRVGDAIADIAFLAMDLERLGDPAAAQYLTSAFATVTADQAPRSLIDFYIAYRAWVRCCTSCLRGSQEGGLGALADAHRYADLALSHLRQAQPRLVAIGGLPASGKSTLAARVTAARPEWSLLRSDLVRNELPDTSVSYATRARGAVYQDMFDRAATQLAPMPFS